MKFKCIVCSKDKYEIDDLQPVSTINGKMCQYCWCKGVWGKEWADEVIVKDPRLI
jgi:hypothetical protein